VRLPALETEHLVERCPDCDAYGEVKKYEGLNWDLLLIINNKGDKIRHRAGRLLKDLLS
jgi:hypothetical protein